MSDALNVFPTNGPTFAILTTGNANLADDPNASGSSGVSLGGPNVRGNTDLDVSILKLDLNVPAGNNCIRFDFAFFSEEFPEYVGSNVNDAFIAELDTSNWTTSGNVITAPNNFAFGPGGAVISVNSSGPTAMNAGNAAGTTYDGATALLSAATPVTPGAHTLYLSIFDQGDRVYDSAVFIDNLAVGFVADPATGCVPGAQSTAVDCPPVTPTIIGTAGNDDIAGTPGADIIFGLGGDDRIAGLAGEDIICGGDGADQLSGGEGNDQMYGGSGGDSLSGLTGNDTLLGGTGLDRLSGGDGDDTLDTRDGVGDDFIVGGLHVTGDTCQKDPDDRMSGCP